MTELKPAGDTELSLPTPAQPVGTACLIHIYPTTPVAGRRYPLDGPLVFGRGDGCDVLLEEPAVSRRHARIDPAGDGHAVRDLGSTNGTRVNDEPVAGTRRLRDGDAVRIGNTVYRYLARGNVEAEYHDELYRRASRDGLTGLHNRRALDVFLGREVARSQACTRPVSVALLDVDRFKGINDAHGHPCGDQVLRDVADLLRAATRAQDLCARYGGEEFALVLVETDHAAALAAAERVRALVAGHPFRFEGLALSVTVSAGVATTCGDGWATPDGLLQAADGHLYAAKRGGRNRVVGADATGAGSTWVVT